MIKRLLNPHILLKITLILTTLLLLPCTAWGVSYKTTGTLSSVGGTMGSTTYKYNWSVTGSDNKWEFISTSQPNTNSTSFNFTYYSGKTNSLSATFTNPTGKKCRIKKIIINMNTHNNCVVSCGSSFTEDENNLGVFTPNNNGSWNSEGTLTLNFNSISGDFTISNIDVQISNDDTSTTFLWPSSLTDGKITTDNGTTTLDVNAYSYKSFSFPLKMSDESNASASRKVNYTISDDNVATINENGEVTIKKTGIATITATLQDNDDYYYETTKTESYTLDVSFPAPTVSQANGTRSFGAPITLTYSGSNDISTKKYKWDDEEEEQTYNPQNPPTVKAGTITVWAEINNGEETISSPATSATYIASYDITVAGTEVTSNNFANILEDGTDKIRVSYNPEKETLTLNGASINGQISSNKGSFTIHLIGENTITAGDGNAPFLHTGGLDTYSINFESTEEEEGVLSIIGGGSFYQHIDSRLTRNNGVSTSVYGIGNKFNPSNITGDWQVYLAKPSENDIQIYRNVLYNLWVGEYRVTKANKTSINSGYPTFDNENMSLKLSEGYYGVVVKSGLENLTLSISGNSCSLGQVKFEAVSGGPKTGTLTIVKTSGEFSSDYNTLTINNDNGAIVGFSNVICSSPMQLITPITAPSTWDETTKSVIISDETFYDLKVAGITVTSGNANNILGQSVADIIPVSFNPANNTLTLNNAEIGMEAPYEGNAIESGLENLTVKLKGTSAINVKAEASAFNALTSTAKITFTMDDAGGMLNLGLNGGIDGFAKKTFNSRLCYVNDNETTPYYYIKYISAPTISLGSTYGSLVVLSLPCDSTGYHSCKKYYTIIDQSGESEVKEYTDPFWMDYPGTVKAWLSADGGESVSASAYGKLFGYSEYNVAPDETITPVLYPTIEGTSISTNFTKDESVTEIEINGNSIKGISEGNADVRAYLSIPSQDYAILNEMEGDFYTAHLYIHVGANLNTIFKDNNEYATYVFDGPESPIMVSEGMKAYVISGLSSDGTQLVYKETSVIPPMDFFTDTGSPVVLLEKGTSKAFFREYAESTDDLWDNMESTFTGNRLKYATPGSPVTATESNKLYILYKDKFVKVTKGTKIGSESQDDKPVCYLDLTGTNAKSRGFSIGTGDSTGIEDIIEESNNDNSWHDLLGRRIAKPQKAGLYIVNGKKVVVNNK